MRRPLGGSDRGQVSVEFLGLLPLILLVLVLLWQCALVGYTYALAAHSADRGARAATATEGGGAGACRTAAEDQLPSAWRDSASASCGTAAGLWQARVRIKVPVLFPGVGDFPWTVTGSAGAAKEARG
ncbi:septum site-determining protein [Streptomyces sp. NBRC 110611]|uniref:TadE/TadG family type IV pilus assembly protein n=1 Tax=Streptomyces sp. NBRC 110611 TaxID=1621259 RepID=UPI000834D0DC|nr:TadE/TadG family type IV pilus assembly protein [Streptomyces sp. NBRC 110611]GAU65177.1 septum site-determining protein [Streptomyces sp. NBRC 110611]